jgi:hypothetical protein
LREIPRSLTENHPVEERLYLMVDAVDESVDRDRYDVIKLLLEICATKGPCVVKVFVASRPIAWLNRYSAVSHRTIRLEDVNSSGILKFAESFLSELELPPDMVCQAKEYIVRHAQGVFVWLDLVRKELRHCTQRGYNKKKIFRLLKSLPTELEGFYERILRELERGEAQDVEVGQRMLEFVLFIPDSLEAAFSCSDESFEEDLLDGFEKCIISCGGNFLEIKGDQGTSFPG